ncbi:MAG: TIGR00366 family protein, partial [Xanthomonadales bacterium]|nr:TIGR00366 family protein [Xanthomonadales bacterium]
QMPKSFKVPHTLVLLFSMIVLSWLLTLVLPAGHYETMVNDHDREVVVPGTYEVLPDVAAPSVWSVFTVIPRGLAAAQGIIFFVFIIGGALAVIRATGALDAALAGILKRFGGRPGALILMGMLAFAVGSSTIGMAEEYIPLVAILITLCVGMKMDTVTAVGIMVAGYGIGYGTAAMNPFTLLVAQEVAGLEPVSGLGFRLAIFLPFLALGFWHVRRYAMKVSANPANSLVADVPEAQPPPPPDTGPLTGRNRAVLVLTLLALILVVWGIGAHGWYLVELGAVFVALAIGVGLVAGLSVDRTAKAFCAGAAELTTTALLIGFARGIELMLSDGEILHTIVHALATPLTHAGGEIAAVGMLLMQSLLNFFIPSGSGQAYVTMPLLAPVSDIVGVSRQVAVLAYQMGDGFMNMIVPTNAVLMGILGMCGIPYGRWFRFIWPLCLQLFALGSLTLIIAVLIGYQ